MKHTLSIFSAVLVLCSAIVIGCEPADTGEGTLSEGIDTTTFNFTGDFAGPLGVQLWSFRNYIQDDIPGTLARVRALGFKEVELAGTYGMTAEQFRQELDNAGLEATAMHVGYELLRDSLESVLDQAETLGVEYVGVAWIPHPEGPFTVEMARQAAADFNAWGEAASARGLQFYYHVHGYEFQPTADGVIPFDVMMQETDPEDVAYEMDVFWVTRPGQDPAALLRKYPDRWKLMHIKDMKEGTPTDDHSGGAPPDTEVPVGTGMIDYAGVLAAAKEVGVERYYIEDETADPWGNIPISTAYLETVAFAQ